MADVYEDDDKSAYSGRERPAYRRLLEDIKAGSVQAVIAWHPDRLHRSTRELGDFIDLINASGCQVATFQAGLGDLTTPSGRMTAKVLGDVAAYESEHKAERITRKMRELSEAGADHGGRRPYGYDETFKAGRRGRQLVINPAEAAVVRDAAARTLAGGTLQDELNAPELVILRLACQELDMIAWADGVLATDGLTVSDRYGAKPHPALVIRAGSVMRFARLARQLGLSDAQMVPESIRPSILIG